jgi:putative MATE family efflux protein
MPDGPQRRSALSIVREAVRGSHRDYTSGPIGSAIVMLAVPMVLEMVMESIFAVVDVFFVAHLGADAVATVGLTESILSIIYSVAMGLAIGASAMVARRTGEGDKEGAAHAAAQALTLGCMVAIALGIVGAVFAPGLLGLLGASPAVVASGTSYARVMFAGNASILLLFLVNAVFRGAGDAAIAMRVLWLANFLNIVLGPCLIFGLGPFPRLGVTGAAIATTTGRSIGVIYAAWRLIRGDGRIAVARRHWRFDFPIIARIARLSGTGILQILIGTASWIGLVRILATFGSTALAGYTIGLRIIVFALLPSWGMSNAAATMVGQALGARKPERAEKAVWLAGFYNMCFLGVVGLLFELFARPIVALFTSDVAVAAYAIDCLRIVAAGFLFYAYGMVISASFNGAGDTVSPTLLNLFCFWLFEIPVAYLLGIRMGMGPRGAFIGMALAFSMLAFTSALVFRRGRWKTRVV